MLRKMIFLVFIFCSFLMDAHAQQPGLGGVASNMLEPVTFASDFVGTACLVIGIGFILASIIKYIEHRRSPLMVPISTVIFLLIAGVILVLLPFLPMVTGSGVPYHFLR